MVIPRNKWVNAKIRVTSSGKIQAKISPGTLRRNPEMKQWDVRIPATLNLGTYRLGPVRKTMAEAKRAALSEYNDSRRREGLSPLRSLPKGTTVRLYS